MTNKDTAREHQRQRPLLPPLLLGENERDAHVLSGRPLQHLLAELRRQVVRQLPDEPSQLVPSLPGLLPVLPLLRRAHGRFMQRRRRFLLAALSLAAAADALAAAVAADAEPPPLKLRLLQVVDVEVHVAVEVRRLDPRFSGFGRVVEPERGVERRQAVVAERVDAVYFGGLRPAQGEKERARGVKSLTSADLILK